MTCSDDFELVKLGDLSEIRRGDRFSKNDNLVDNNYLGKKYPHIGGTGKMLGHVVKFNRSGRNCIISRVGGLTSKNCAKIVSGNIFVTDASFTINVNDNESLNNYIHHYLVTNYDKIFTNNASGSCQITISSINTKRNRNTNTKICRKNERMGRQNK